MDKKFGDLLAQYLHRKHGLSQAKLAHGIQQDPAIISKMCRGERLSGRYARERVLDIIAWLAQQGVLTHSDEADALLTAAGLAQLRHDAPCEASLISLFDTQSESHPIYSRNQINHAEIVRGHEQPVLNDIHATLKKLEVVLHAIGIYVFADKHGN